MEEAIEFPYKIYKGISCPIIGLEICGPKGWLRTEAYVDSGAFMTILAQQEAKNLGIDFQKGRKTFATVGDGGLIPIYLHTLPIRLGGISFRATLSFSSRLGVGFNLLGRRDFFSRFDILFSDASKTITFIPRKR